MNAREREEIQAHPGDGEAQPIRAEIERASIPELVRLIARDTADLIRQEINLARLELRDTTRALARETASLAIGLGLAAAGGLALTAFLILVLGNLFNGAYWASSLLVGGLFLIGGAVIAYRALRSIRRQRLAPDETIQTLREDREWAKGEARDFRRDLAA